MDEKVYKKPEKRKRPIEISTSSNSTDNEESSSTASTVDIKDTAETIIVKEKVFGFDCCAEMS